MDTSSAKAQIIRERIKEFEDAGNRDLTPSGLQFYGEGGGADVEQAISDNIVSD